MLDLSILLFSTEACSLPKDNGPCREFTVKWFYDGVDYGGCNRFWYGGCEGNGNRFKSLEECRGVCVEPQGKGMSHVGVPMINEYSFCFLKHGTGRYPFRYGVVLLSFESPVPGGGLVLVKYLLVFAVAGVPPIINGKLEPSPDSSQKPNIVFEFESF